MKAYTLHRVLSVPGNPFSPAKYATSTIFKNEHIIINHIEYTNQKDKNRTSLSACCPVCGFLLLPSTSSDGGIWACTTADGCGKICLAPSSDFHPASLRETYCKFVDPDTYDGLFTLRMWIAKWLDISVVDIELEVSWER